MVAAVVERAIPDLAGGGAGFVPEEFVGGALDIVQKLVVRSAVRGSIRLVERFLIDVDATEARLGKVRNPTAVAFSISRRVMGVRWNMIGSVYQPREMQNLHPPLLKYKSTRRGISASRAQLSSLKHIRLARHITAARGYPYRTSAPLTSHHVACPFSSMEAWDPQPVQLVGDVL